jgi:preprotein translocase subunit SecF
VGAILFIGAFLLGAGTLKDLSLALFVGIATGTYSSVFIATPLLADLREREPEMKTLRRRVLARRAEGSKAATAPRPTRGRARTAVLDRPGEGADSVSGDGTGDLAGADAGRDVPTDPAPRAAGASAAGSGAARRRTSGPRNQPRRGGSRSKRR